MLSLEVNVLDFCHHTRCRHNNVNLVRIRITRGRAPNRMAKQQKAERLSKVREKKN